MSKSFVALAFIFLMSSVSMRTAMAIATEAGAEAPQPFNDNLFPMVLIGAGCVAVGAPICILVSESSKDEPDSDFKTKRSSDDIEAQFGFFPSYVLDFAESKAFQRIEIAASTGNLLFGLHHRRGVQEPNSFSSSSYRIAYSFDWKHVRPAIGLGLRKNLNARNGDGIELWFPIFSNRSKTESFEFDAFMETIWTFGAGSPRPEVQIRLETPFAPHAVLAFGVGYFPDYDNPEMEISVGPVAYF